jgi:hypothetical protein
MTWYVVTARRDAAPEDDVWTVSMMEGVTGWETDSGCLRYGLPKNVAEYLVRLANAAEERGDFVDFDPTENSRH